MATPCSFKEGDRVARKGKDGGTIPGLTGTVVKVEYHGPASGAGAYDCTYVVRRDNGQTFNAREGELQKLPA